MRSVVLLSGGLDSVVNLHLAHKEGAVVLALTFDYGQRAADNEVRAARFFSEKLNIKHQVIEISWLKEITHTALVNSKEKLPHLRDLDDLAEAGNSALKVWVPNRNGVFLNIAGAFAESLKADYVIPGFNKEEAATFPDNSKEYLKKATEAFSLSTLKKVRVHCFTLNDDKKTIAKKAQDLKIEKDRIWSCYQAGEKICGVCESCQRFERAFS